MRDVGDVRLDAVLLGVAPPVRGSVEALTGERLAVRRPGRVDVHAQEPFLAGATDRPVLSSLDLQPHESAAVAPDGGFVVAGSAGLRAVTPWGAVRWELPHDPWHSGHRPPRPPGAPAVSPCGRHVAVVVPTLLADGDRGEAAVYDGPPRLRYGRDHLLLLDAVTGRIRARRPVAAVSDRVSLCWRADAEAFAVSCWTAWYSWTTYWVRPGDEGMEVTGGTAFHEAVGFLPASSRLLTMRRAEHLTLDDDRYELAWHDVSDPSLTETYDLGRLSWTPEEDDFADAHVLDATRLLVTSDQVPREGPLEHTHWLLDAPALRPLGRLRYPVPVRGDVVPLADGTWLTCDKEATHHWSAG
ncbi:hypothetical protein ACF1G0_26925 [Streptomyces sp. NPDC013953]|uniref:hypothetical protein n=1 Tax=Streptomyces sp. NPDC013953 TaxID=3364868 RepID=UPI0037028324